MQEHVNAKRYLTATNPKYLAKLSPASCPRNSTRNSARNSMTRKPGLLRKPGLPIKARRSQPLREPLLLTLQIVP